MKSTNMLNLLSSTEKKLNFFRSIKGVKTLVEIILKFSNLLFEEETKKLSSHNFAISPVNVFLSLCCIANGSQDSCKEQILNFLKILPTFEDNIEIFNELTSVLFDMLTNNPGSNIQNKHTIFYNKPNTTINSLFMDVKDKFYPYVQLKTFEEFEKINDVVNLISEKKVKKLITEDFKINLQEVEGSYVITQTNYMKEKWLYAWVAEKTLVKFNVPSDTPGQEKKGGISTPVMNLRNVTLHYGEHDWKTCKFNSLAIPMQNCNFLCLVLLPINEGSKQIQSLQEKLVTTSGNVFKKIQEEQKPAKVTHCQMPLFKVDYSRQYGYLLKDLGLKIPFDENNANFYSLASDGMKLFDVFQKTIFVVDDQGMEEVKKPEQNDLKKGEEFPEIEFIVNRPFFLFLLNRFDCPVYYMKIVNPMERFSNIVKKKNES